MKYKRLTNDEYNPEYDFCCDCKYYGEPNGCNRKNGECANYERFIEMYNRLAELEDKIENGTLVELPCKMGDSVFVLFDPYFIADIFTMEVEKIVIRDGKIIVCGEDKDAYECRSVVSDYIFLTKEGAEKRLEELRGEKREKDNDK